MKRRLKTMSKMLMINGEQFPMEKGQFGNTDTRVTGRHFVYVTSQDVSQTLANKIAASGLVDIRDIAEEKVLELYPEYQELTMYGTRRKGFYALLNAQIRKTLYWVINKQPGSLTIICDKIDGMKEYTPNSVYGLVQLNMQSGVTTQVVIPATGYSCMVQPVYNKKKMELFTATFTCEKTVKLYEDGKLMDTTLIAHIDEVYAKVERLQDYRQSVQNAIWDRINFELKEQGFVEQWKQQNVFTMHTRVAYAVNKQTELTLAKYAEDMKIPAANALTIEHLRDPKVYNQMLRVVSNYAAAFGIRVKTTEQTSDITSFIPHHWYRDDNHTMTDSVMLRRAYNEQQSRQRDSLNDLLTAYIQVDWYMSQTDMENFLVDGYMLCEECRHIISKHDESCPVCGRKNSEFIPDELSYEVLEFKVSRDDE